MNLRPLFAHYVLNADPTYRQRITNERAVTPPWNGFRTHNHAPLLLGQFHQSV